MEARALQPAGDLARVAHLRVRQASVSETINQNAKRRLPTCRGGANSAISLYLQLNAPIPFEGPEVAILADDRDLVISEIPPGAFLHGSRVLAALVLPPDRPMDGSRQGLIPSQTTALRVTRN
jgi:hypothetical protein